MSYTTGEQVAYNVVTPPRKDLVPSEITFDEDGLVANRQGVPNDRRQQRVEQHISFCTAILKSLVQLSL